MISSCLKRGVNNFIGNNVRIHENVVIGNNNKIFDGTTLYPNTIIGDNNVILNGNIIGEYPVNANEDLENFIKTYEKGVIIGNNNFIHVNNLIFGGTDSPTKIGNNNKLLGEIHVGHDVEIFQNAYIYPRVLLSGYVKVLPCAGIGVSTSIHQKKTIGHYSFIGMNSTITKNIFPFYKFINQRYKGLNEIRIPEYIVNDKEKIDEIISSFYSKKKIHNLEQYNLNDNTKTIIEKFLLHV
jgi:UDP-N-acetylglucosamine acyltransferase